MIDCAAEQKWPKLTRVSGKTCALCHQLLTLTDCQANKNRCRNCAVAARLGRVWDVVLVGIGFLVCWSFFAAGAWALSIFWFEADWSAFSNKLANVSLSELIAATCKLGLLLAATSALFGWAFLKPGRKNYRSWGVVACYVSAAILLFYIVRHRP